MSEPRGLLIAIDGVDGAAVAAAARQALSATTSSRRGGISWWDASGLFWELGVASDTAGQPSARTLLLLYAADLAFRLRWEIEPALADGKTVVAASYVQTDVAFGRSVGLPSGWLTNLFRFAPQAGDRRLVNAAPRRRSGAKPRNFAEFGCARLSGSVLGLTRKQLVARTHAHLSAAAARTSRGASS